MPQPTSARSGIRFLVLLLALGIFIPRVVQAADPSSVSELKRIEAKSRAVAARVVGATVGIINQSLATSGRLGEGSGVVVSEDGIDPYSRSRHSGAGHRAYGDLSRWSPRGR